MSDSLQMPALGRPFCLGMLYNQHHEKIIPGISLWNESTLAEHVVVQDQYSCHTAIIENDDISTKSKSLDISGNLKMSLLGGAFMTEGAAKYVYDRKSSSRQVKVAIKYSCTTHYKQMSMEHIGNIITAHPDIEKSGATHVVLGVLYGSDAFLVFAQECGHDEVLHEIEGKIKSSALFVEGLSGGLSGEKNSRYVSNNNRVTIQLYGDVPIGDISNGKDAYSTIRAKIMELRLVKEKSIVKTVFLYPLSQLNSINWQVPKVFSVSEVLTLQIEGIMENLHSIQTELNDLQKRKECQIFESVGKQILLVSKNIEQFEAKFKTELSNVIYKVRFSGNMQILQNLIQCVKQSPFSSTNLESYIRGKECELGILVQYKKSLSEHRVSPGLVFPCSQKEYFRLIHDIDVGRVIGLHLNLTPLQTSQMKKMAQYLQHSMVLSDPTTSTTDASISTDIALVGTSNTPDNATDFNRTNDGSDWFYNKEIQSKLKTTMKKLKTFIIDNENNPKLRIVVLEGVYQQASELLQYTKDGQSTKDHIPPELTKTPRIICAGYNYIKLALHEQNGGGIKYSSWLIHYRCGEDKITTTTDKNVITLPNLWWYSTCHIRAQAILYSHCICPTSSEVTVDTTMYGTVDNHEKLNKLAN